MKDESRSEEAAAGQRTAELYLLRHAHAGDPLAWGGDDADRPLSARGQKQSARLARFLDRRGFRPDAIISSPKVRAVQTAEPLAKQLGLEILVDHRLAEGPDLDEIEAILATAGDPARPVLVGHDPAFSTLVAELIGAPWFDVPKGTFLRIDTERPPSPGGGLLRWLISPDLLNLDS
jgi:phosphohistidine phosphatase SixA